MTEPRESRANERPELGFDPRESDAESPFDAKAGFAALEASIAAEARSPFARLRELASPMRLAAAIVVASLTAIAVGTSTCERDLTTFPVSRLVLESGLLVAAMSICLVIAMRPMHVPAISRRRSALAMAVALGVGVVLAVLPYPDVESPALGPMAPPSLLGGIPCLRFGTLVGIPVFLFARMLERGTRASSWHSAAAGGLAGTLALTIHCPSPDVAHRLSSHASLGFLFLAALALAYAVVRSTRSGRES